MKVVAISSSPRTGGNSDLLCDQFLKGAEESGHTVKKIAMAGAKLSPCYGCDACQKSGVCVQNDDIPAMVEALIDADVILLASPVYFYSISAQLKMLIDRCYPKYQEIKDKLFYYAFTCGDSNESTIDGAVDAIRKFTGCFSGSKEVGILKGAGAVEKGDVKNMPVFQEAYEMGKSL